METRGLIKIIILVLLCLVVHAITSGAQTLYTKNSQITVATNTAITVRGSVENAGTILNNGHLKVSGPWINSGVYIPGEGMVTFNSTSATVPQIIHHNGQTFNRVTLAGATKKIILSDLTIGREIHFQNGVVEAAGDARTIFEDGVTISGASDSSHIHGVVYQSGAGNKLFPIGNGLHYLPVELLDVQDPTAVIGIESFEFGNVMLAKAPSIQSVSDKRYWHIDVISGDLDDSKVVLPLRDETWSVDPKKIVVVQSPAPTENFTSIGRSFFEGQISNGRVGSIDRVTMPFVALAAEEGELVIHNALSPNGDGLNEFLTIENIENYPVNKFSVYNRWGDKVFEIMNYDNADQVFRGRSNIASGKELGTATYFYVLELPGGQSFRGFIALKN